MQIKCPHCGASFELDLDCVNDLGGSRCGVCMQPFKSEVAASDKQMADDSAHCEEQSNVVKNQGLFTFESHSHPKVPGFLRLDEANSNDEATTEDEAQVPLPLSSDQSESQSAALSSTNSKPQEFDKGQSDRFARLADRGFGNISNGSGAYDRVVLEKADLQYRRVWLVAAIIFSILAAAQFVNLNKLELSQTIFGRPIVNLWCEVSGCLAGDLVQLNKIDLVHTSVSAHDTKEGILAVDIHMVSRTIFSQPYPSIQITLTNRNGMPVARRAFSAHKYLADTISNELAPNVIAELTLEIADTPDDSVGFEVALVNQR